MKLSRALLLAGALSFLAPPRLASAQEYATDRGSLLLGGSGGVTRTTFTNIDGDRTFDTSSTYAYLAPSVQYFVRPGLALGGTLNLGRVGQEGQSSTSYGVGPIVSYYFGAGQEKLHPYFSGSATLNRSSGFGGGETGYGWGGRVGSLYLLSPAVGLDVGLFYRREGERGSAAHRSNLGLSLGFSAFTF